MSLPQLLLAGRFPTLISFFAIVYLFMFLPASILIYSLAPQKARKYVLLALSYGFYWLISGQLIVYLLLSTLSVHYFGLWLDRLHARRTAALAAAPREEKKALRAAWQRKLRGVVALAVLAHVGVLFTLKYSGFFFWNINALCKALHLRFALKIPKYLQPLGISFFTMQALAYILDVYRGTQQADENLGRLALFMAFFPHIVEGPICRYKDTAEQLWSAQPIEFRNLKFGIQRVLFGAMKKMVIADRLNRMVETIFADPAQFNGGVIALAALAYTVQLYMDFSGSMDAVCGTAQIFGVAMPENFQRPFFSKTISEFWQRWHITLGTWFRDYVFYPVSTSKPMKSLTLSARKRLGNHFGPLLAGGVALFCVWFCNGLWHGAGWNYIFFGMYHFALILAGSAVAPAVRAVNGKLRIDANRPAYRAVQMVRTAVLVVIGELFFRADSLRTGFAMFKRMIVNFRLNALSAETLAAIHMNGREFGIVGFTLLLVLAVSILNERGVSVRAWLEKRNIVVRWALLYALILFIVIFGAYGYGYVPVDPMYAEF